MNQLKYIGMDVHKAMTVIFGLNSEGKELAQAIIETKSTTIIDFIQVAEKKQRTKLTHRGCAPQKSLIGSHAAILWDRIPWTCSYVSGSRLPY